VRRRQQPGTAAAWPLLPQRRSTSAEVAAEGPGDLPHGLRNKQSPQNGVNHLTCQASTSEAPRLGAAERRGCCKLRHNWQPLHGSAQACRARLERQSRAPVWRVLAGTGTLLLTRRRLMTREGGASFSFVADQASCKRRTSGLSKELHPEAVHLVGTSLCGTSRPAAGARALAAPPAADCAASGPPAVATGSMRMRTQRPHRQADSARAAARRSWRGRAAGAQLHAAVGRGRSGTGGGLPRRSR